MSTRRLQKVSVFFVRRTANFPLLGLCDTAAGPKSRILFFQIERNVLSKMMKMYFVMSSICNTFTSHRPLYSLHFGHTFLDFHSQSLDLWLPNCGQYAYWSGVSKYHKNTLLGATKQAASEGIAPSHKADMRTCASHHVTQNNLSHHVTCNFFNQCHVLILCRDFLLILLVSRLHLVACLYLLSCPFQ